MLIALPAMSIRPIKRSSSLTPLSREHHDGLLFAWKVRQGTRKGIAIERIIAFCNWFWENDLKEHFRKEEKAFDRLLHSEHPMWQRMIAEHRHITRLFSQLGRTTTPNDLELLATGLSDHIRFEERQLFNELEKVAAPEDLRNSVELHEARICEEWGDVFWNYPC